MTVNHCRLILSTTHGHPARFNDKILVMFDDFVNKVKHGFFDDKHEFTLLDFDVNGNVIDVKYKG